MYTHLFVKQPQRCNGQRVHLSLGRTWARFQVPGLVKPRAKTMIFISSIIGVVMVPVTGSGLYRYNNKNNID